MNAATPIATLPIDGGVDQTKPTPFVIARQAGLLVLVAILMLLIVLYVGWQTANLRAQLAQRTGRAASIAADVDAIQQLSSTPKSVRETEVPHADLLQQVNAAMHLAGLDANRLISTSSEAPRHIGNSPLSEVTQRLLFSALDLQTLAGFCHALCSTDASLRITAIQLRSGSGKKDWSADISVSYWISTPLQTSP